MLQIDTTILACIDMQENLARAMFDRAGLIASTVKLISGCTVLGIPVLWTEQNPERLGATLPEIAAVMPQGERPAGKMSFSCCGSGEFLQALKTSGCTDVLLSGIETHICVLQTAADLLEQGFRVQAVSDCMGSRTQQNNAVGIERMRSLGVQITSVETALFELLRTAANPKFREIAKIIK